MGQLHTAEKERRNEIMVTGFTTPSPHYHNQETIQIPITRVDLRQIAACPVSCVVDCSIQRTGEPQVPCFRIICDKHFFLPSPGFGNLPQKTTMSVFELPTTRIFGLAGIKGEKVGLQAGGVKPDTQPVQTADSAASFFSSPTGAFPLAFKPYQYFCGMSARPMIANWLIMKPSNGPNACSIKP